MTLVTPNPRWLNVVRVPEYWNGKKISNGRLKLARKSTTAPVEVPDEAVRFLVDNYFAQPDNLCEFNKAPEGVPFWPQEGEGHPGRVREERIVELLSTATKEKLVELPTIGEKKADEIIAKRSDKKLAWEDCDRLLSAKQQAAVIEWLETCPPEEEPVASGTS